MRHPNDPREWLDAAEVCLWLGVAASWGSGILPEWAENYASNGLSIFGLLCLFVWFTIMVEMLR